MFYAGTTQLGHFYNLSVMSTFGGSDLCDPACWQAGKDDAVDAFYICATGPDMLPCVGMMETYTRLHPEKLLLDDSIIQSVQRMTRGIPVNGETLSIDEIIKVGPGGHFLDTEYTLQNMRKLWNSGIDHQWSPDTGQFKNPSKAAKEKLKWILENHEPVPLDKAASKEIKQIIQSAEQAL